MATGTEFTIGAEARCSDGDCGDISRVVVDPVARSITHLVVQPKHETLGARLVPLDLVDTSKGDVRIRCTLAEFEKLDTAVDAEFLPGVNGFAGFGPGHVLLHPYYRIGFGAGLGIGGLGSADSALGMGSAGAKNISQLVTHDALPAGEIGVRRGQRVYATDGLTGKIQGFVMDPWSHRVTHVLLQEGHPWGSKEVGIPADAVVGVNDGIRLNISKDQVRDLPAVDIDRQYG